MGQIRTYFIRNVIRESTHNIKCIIGGPNNNVIFSTNNEDDYIYPRSSIKIFQAIPFASSNAINKFNLNGRQVALSCSSHHGENYHIKELNSWIKKTKIKINNLKCGIHHPLDTYTNKKLISKRIKPSELHNNCSGKHLAMISSCLRNKYTLENYLDFSHLHQIKIRKVLETFTESKILQTNYAIDGCSAPQYAFKLGDLQNCLQNLYRSYKSKFNFSEEVKVLIKSIIKNPFYIGGSLSLDSNLMKISDGNLFCKVGAEGVFLFCHLKKGISGVVKVEDGNERALTSTIFEITKKFKLLNRNQLKKFFLFGNFKIENHAKLIVGKVKTKII